MDGVHCNAIINWLAQGIGLGCMVDGPLGNRCNGWQEQGCVCEFECDAAMGIQV